VNMLDEEESYGTQRKEKKETRRRWVADVILFCLQVSHEEQKRIMRMERGIVSTTLKRNRNIVTSEDVDKQYNVYLGLDPHSIQVVDIRKEAEMKRSSFGHKERMLWSGREAGYMNNPYVPTSEVTVENPIVKHKKDVIDKSSLKEVELEIRHLNMNTSKHQVETIAFKLEKNKAWTYKEKGVTVNETRPSILKLLNERRERYDMKKDIKDDQSTHSNDEERKESVRNTHLILWEKDEKSGKRTQRYQIKAKLSSELNDNDPNLPPHVVWDARSERMKVYDISQSNYKEMKLTCYLSEDGKLFPIFAVLDANKPQEQRGDLYSRIEDRSGLKYFIKVNEERVDLTEKLKNMFRADLITKLV